MKIRILSLILCACLFLPLFAACGQETPSEAPTVAPTVAPTDKPTAEPTAALTVEPTVAPTVAPTVEPTVVPTTEPTAEPTAATDEPTEAPSECVTLAPTDAPTETASESPSAAEPTTAPTAEPTLEPTVEPTTEPTTAPTAEPTTDPTVAPTVEPTAAPTIETTAAPTAEPTAEPTDEPTAEPTDEPTTEPTVVSTDEPTPEPTAEPTDKPCTHEEGSFVPDGEKYHVYRYTCDCEDAPAVKERHEDENADDLCDVCEKNLKQEIVSLDGKKIIFIGDSFIYYGCTVLERTQTTLSRNHSDYGLFYQLCKANGENVKVTNFTFGGHGLGAIIAEECTTSYGCKGENHMSYLTDRDYDYVVMSGGRNSKNTAAALYSQVEYFMDTFREANPDVKFIYLVSSGAHNISVSPTLPHDVLNGLDELEDMGVTVVDWGALVADIINGEVTVPGATETYSKNTFIVNKSASDGYHPNQLSGYITTLMTYCAITGRSAVGQPYDFVGDSSLTADSNYRTFEKYIAKYYREGQTTNYPPSSPPTPICAAFRP